MRPVIALLAGAGVLYGVARVAGRVRHPHDTTAQARPDRREPAPGQHPGADVTSPPVQTGDPATDTAIRMAHATYSTEKIQTP